MALITTEGEEALGRYMATTDYEPQWIDDGSPGGMYRDRYGNTSKDGGVTWSNGYSSGGGYSDPYAGGAGDFYGGTPTNQPFWTEATQRTEDPGHPGRYWDSNTHQWTGGDLGNTAIYGPQQEFTQAEIDYGQSLGDPFSFGGANVTGGWQPPQRNITPQDFTAFNPYQEASWTDVATDCTFARNSGSVNRPNLYGQTTGWTTFSR